MPFYDSSFGGVSAVDPQAQGNYQQYQDAAFANAKMNLDPILSQQRSSYDQQMVNMGLPVGGEAYNKAFQQLDANQNQAWNNAAFGAMQFGLDVQNQDFQQDATRAGLANALLQSQWANELGYYNTDTTKDIADGRLGFDYAALGEDGRQFDAGLGFDYASLGEQGRQFDSSLDQRGYEFDQGLGFDYAQLGQQNDQFNSNWLADLYRFDTGMDFNYFNADRDDMRWLTELGMDSWNQQINNNRWSDRLGQNLINPYDPNMVDPSGAVNNAYRNQVGQYGIDSGNNNAWWQNFGSIIDTTGQNQGWWGG